MDLTERVYAIVGEQLGVEKEALVPEANLLDDLGADSLDVVELVMAIEEEYRHSPDLAKSALDEVTAAAILGALLGETAALRCRWSAQTVWQRSVRGIVNERARWGQAECSCTKNVAAQQSDAVDERRA